MGSNSFIYPFHQYSVVMAYDPSREVSLKVDPDEQGVKARQAEYLLLSFLDRHEVAPKDSVRAGVRRLSARVADDREEPPVYFSTTSGRSSHKNREFNEVLDRCLHRGWVEQTIDGAYGITDEGVSRVEQLESEWGSRYEIDEELRAAVESDGLPQ